LRTIQRIRRRASTVRQALTPPRVAWRGAAVAVYVLGCAAVTAFFVIAFLQDFAWQKLPAFIVWIGVLVLAGLSVVLTATIVMMLPRVYRVALAVCAPFVMLMLFPGAPAWRLGSGAVLLLVVSLIGGSAAVIRENALIPRRRKAAVAGLSVGVVLLIAGLVAIFIDKGPANPALEGYTLGDRTLDLPNPGLPGRYEVRTLTYGSGTDRRRPEFGENVDLVSRRVDGSKLIENWDGFSGWLRTSYWGFDVTELPLQARVWYPDGDGAFPLVLIVHGNHAMEDYSDPGYAYLGELLASRGIIVASVDQNFINFAISASVEIFADRPGLKEENDARGWLLLEHLALWRDWNADAENPFHGKIDTDRLALIGHSRGGEAVGVAAAFNALDRYPDDASLEFDYRFNLRGVIAIAPVYGQYQPRERPTPIVDVNYFTIHGEMDGDVQSFEGMAQYSRTTFSGSDYRFRAGLYVAGANHGQFNTTWGNIDTWLYDAWALDLGRLMDGEDQRNVAKVFFSAFLEIVLNERLEYLPIFRDARYAAGWLPNTYFINRYADSADIVIADFEEDIDPATLTLPGGTITTDNVSRWYETGNKLKYDELDTHSVVIAWDKAYSEEAARMDLTLPAPRGGSALVASISAIDIDTLPEDYERDDDDTEDDPLKDSVLDWTVQLTDAQGNTASVPLSADSGLYPLVNALPRRARFLESEEPTEILFRRFELPMAAFAGANERFDPASVLRVSFLFDRADRGAIIIDDIGFATRP